MLALGRFTRLFVVAKVIKPEMLGDALKSALKNNAQTNLKDSNKALRVAVIKVWSNIIVETPVDQGRARGNWFVTLGQPSQQLTERSDSTKGSSHVVSKTSDNMLGKKWFLTNNLPYIRKIEFGGYGNKDTDKTNSQGFSKLAPKGMVRTNLVKFPGILRKAFKAIV